MSLRVTAAMAPWGCSLPRPDSCVASCSDASASVLSLARLHCATPTMCIHFLAPVLQVLAVVGASDMDTLAAGLGADEMRTAKERLSEIIKNAVHNMRKEEAHVKAGVRTGAAAAQGHCCRGQLD